MGGALLGHVPVPAGLGLLHHRLLPRLGRGVAILTVAILTVAIDLLWLYLLWLYYYLLWLLPRLGRGAQRRT